MSITLWTILFALIGGVFSLIGGVFLLKNDQLVKQNTLSIVSWAAGVLLSVALLDLMPEAVEMAIDRNLEIHTLFQFSLFAIIGFFILERSFLWFHHHHEPNFEAPTNTMLIIGDSLHNFIDGIIIATAFLVSIPTGIVTAIAVAAHEIPQEIADFGIFIKSGLSKAKVFTINLFSSFMTVIGAVITLYFSSYVQTITPQLLAFAGGMFIYIACSDLIPELHHAESRKVATKQVFFFFFGIIITYVLTKVAHGH